MIGCLEDFAGSQSVIGFESEFSGGAFRDDGVSGAVGIEGSLSGVEASRSGANVLPGGGLIEGLCSGPSPGIEIAIEESPPNQSEVGGEWAEINGLRVQDKTIVQIDGAR